MVTRLFIFFICSLCVTSNSVAAVYQWRDESGRVHFSDVPAPGAKQITTADEKPDTADIEKHRQIQSKLKQTLNRQGADRRRQDRANNYQRGKSKRARAQSTKRCNSARQRLEHERDSWHRKGRKGYRNRDKLNYLERKRRLEKRVSESC